jgi:putative peptidoglycan lipid II flippase
VITNLSRVMFVIGRLKIAAAAVAGSWLLVIAAEVVLAELVPARLVVAALALGFTVGQTVVAIPMIIVTRRICGPAAVHGVWRAAAASLIAGVAGAVVGAAVTLALPLHHKLLDAGVAALGAAGAVIAFGVVAYLLDSDDLKTVLARLRRLVRSRR